MSDKDLPERMAPEGYVWVCLMCGKIARGDRYGFDGKADEWWDESCILNCQLFKKSNLELDNGRVVSIRVDEDEDVCPDPEGSQ